MANKKYTALDLVEHMLANEENVAKQIKVKKKIKYAPRKAATEKDLKLSGWNLKFDPDYKEKYSKGDILSRDLFEMRVISRASKCNMACVFSTKHSIYGWGKNIDEAIRACHDNVCNWRKTYPDLINKLPTKLTSKVKKTEDKSVSDLLNETGL